MAKKQSTVKKKEQEEQKKKKSLLVMGLIIIFLMVSSLLAFALNSGTQTGAATGEEMPANLELQQVQYEGQTVWVAIKNEEQFVFEGVSQFEGREDLEALVNQMASQSSVDLYIEPGYSNGDAIFLIEKSLSALDIPTQRISEMSCNSNTIVITTNQEVEGECMVFNYQGDEATLAALGIGYYTVIR